MAFSDSAEMASKYFKWAVLVLSAAFAADLSASALERQLETKPEAVEVAAATMESKSHGKVELSNLLREDGSAEAAQDGTGSSAGSGDSESAKDIDGAVLIGTLINGYTRAAILEKSGESSMVMLGSEMGNYILQTVEGTWVYFAPKEGGGKGVRLAMETVIDPVFESLVATPNPEEKGDAKGDEVVKERLSLEDIRAALNDTGKIASEVRVVPQTKDDQPYGTKLVFRKPKNIMAQMGLQDQDVLLSVNGNPARTVEDMYQGYMTLRNAPSLEFVVDRGGQQITVRYELAKS